jgi:hypothetical protein
MIRSTRVIRLLGVALLFVGGLISCSTVDSPTAPVAAPNSAELRRPLLSGLLACQPQPCGRQVRVVGPAGGTLLVGGHS